MAENNTILHVYTLYATFKLNKVTQGDVCRKKCLMLRAEQWASLAMMFSILLEH